jgi:hypothetical protein
MALELSWKPEEFGRGEPHFVVRHTTVREESRAYGVYAWTGRGNRTHPVGSGRGLSRDRAIEAAEEFNARVRTGRDD